MMGRPGVHAIPAQQWRPSLESVSADDLHSAWPLILPGILEVHKNSVSHWLPEDVYSAIRTGHSSLHLGYVDGEYVGFMVLTPSSGWDGRQLHMWCTFNASQHDVMEIFEPDLVRLARQIGARRVSFWSPRRGWERVAGRYGFVPNQVEYVKELV